LKEFSGNKVKVLINMRGYSRMSLTTLKNFMFNKSQKNKIDLDFITLYFC